MVIISVRLIFYGRETKAAADIAYDLWQAERWVKVPPLKQSLKVSD